MIDEKAGRGPVRPVVAAVDGAGRTVAGKAAAALLASTEAVARWLEQQPDVVNGQLTRDGALRVVLSLECACGEKKKKLKAFCYDCFGKLTLEQQARLYKRIGEGFERAYVVALCWLQRREGASAGRETMPEQTEGEAGRLASGQEVCE